MYQPTNAKQITSAVAERLDTLKDEGLALPAHYNAQNALKAAYLCLQTVKDRKGRPALTVCTEPSIANALLDMAIQGLSPAKNQCYFIVYGNELQMQRSYFGTIAALKRLDSIDDIDAQVIHQGDEFEIGADETGHIIVTKFKPSFANLDKSIKGAFDFEDTDTQYLMKEALEEIKEKQDRFWQVMNGEVEPKHCGKCEYCRSMKELAAFQHVTDIEVD